MEKTGGSRVGAVGKVDGQILSHNPFRTMKLSHWPSRDMKIPDKAAPGKETFGCPSPVLIHSPNFPPNKKN